MNTLHFQRKKQIKLLSNISICQHSINEHGNSILLHQRRTLSLVKGISFLCKKMQIAFLMLMNSPIRTILVSIQMNGLKHIIDDYVKFSVCVPNKFCIFSNGLYIFHILFFLVVYWLTAFCPPETLWFFLFSFHFLFCMLNFALIFHSQNGCGLCTVIY